MPLSFSTLSPVRVLISTASVRSSMGSELASNAAVAASAAWPAANRALYMPLYIESPGVVAKLWWLNGATASGNVDIGLYNADYTKIVSAGSTAQGTINVLQEVDIADVTLARGTYYIGMASDDATATFYRLTPSNLLVAEAAGQLQQSSAFPLPSPAVPVATASVYVPYCGIAFRTLVA